MDLKLESDGFSLQLNVLSPPMIFHFNLFTLEVDYLELRLLEYGMTALLKIFHILARVIICCLLNYLVVEMKSISQELQHSTKYPETRSMPRRGLGLRLPFVAANLLDDAIASCAIRLRRFSRTAVKQGLRRMEWICASKTKSHRVPHHS